MWDILSVRIAIAPLVETFRVEELRVCVGVDTRNKMANVKVNAYRLRFDTIHDNDDDDDDDDDIDDESQIENFI